MNNAELIAELRGHIREVPLTLLHEAADALETAEKRIAELEAARMELTTKCRRLQAQMRTVTDCHTLEERER